MELSILLAKVIGLILMIVSAVLLINKKNIDLLFDIYSHPAAVFITGLLETVLGIVFVINHYVWTPLFRGIISAIGLVLLLRGLGRVLFPYRTVRLLKKFRKMRSVFTLLLVFVFIIGAYLAYVGFTG